MLAALLVLSGCTGPAPDGAREGSGAPTTGSSGPDGAPEGDADAGPAPSSPSDAPPPEPIAPAEPPLTPAQAADRAAGVLDGPLPEEGPGTTVVVPGSTEGSGQGRRFTLRVEVEDGLPVDGGAFAGFVMATLTDPRGWSREGWDFVRVDGEADAVLTLASARTSERMCAPLVTRGTLSCRVGPDVVLTAVRWTQGADAYGEDLTGYRQYLVGHEVGHAIGKGHVGCPGPGKPAPTMLQQTKGVGACTAQPWPHP